MRRGLTPFFAVVLVLLGSVSPAAAEQVQWLSPVDAPVVDPFRPPSTRFGAGNRGLEFGLNEATEVVAVDGGRVTFAGRVGNDLFVTIDHGNGLRSTLGYLQSTSVVRGQYVSIGEAIGVGGSGLHLTARLDGVYIDPALLIAGVELAVALVAGVPPPVGAQPVARGGGGAIGRGWFDPDLAVLHSAEALMPSTLMTATAEAADQWFHTDCSDVDGGVATTPSGDTVDLRPANNGNRVLVQVGGLGSHSGGASIGKLDPLALGYNATDVKGFSYAGGCIATPFGFDGPGMEIAGHQPVDYQPEDTYQDIELSAERLADLVEAAADARPGATIDIAAHSLGGVVTRRAVEVLAERGRVELLGVVMTVGSPHAGANLATIASAAHGGLDLVDHASPEIAGFRDAASVIQLSSVGANSIGPSAPPPDGPQVIAIAGSSDLVVPGPAAIWDGATNVVVNLADAPGAHSNLPGTPEVHDALALGLAGAAPACVGLGEVLLGAAAGSAVSAAENAAAIAAGATRWLL